MEGGDERERCGLGLVALGRFSGCSTPVMNGASHAGQRPVSQLTEMNRIEPSRAESYRARGAF